MDINRDSVSIQSIRDYRLDTIKAISICFVFLWHVNPVSSENIIVKSIFSLLLHNIFLIAVPSFITVSLLLFFNNYKSKGIAYFKTRMLRLFKIFMFWFLIQNTIYILVQREAPIFSLQLIFSGGPSLPIVGGSVFYFFSQLIILTNAAFLFFLLPEKVKFPLSVIVVILTFSYFAASSTFGYKLPHSYLLSFVIYIPLSHYLPQNTRLIVKYRFVLLLLFAASISYEKITKIMFDVIEQPYSRISIVIGVVLLFCMVYSYNSKENVYAKALSMYSLGIFSIHKYFQLLSYYIFNEISSTWIHSGNIINLQYPFIFIGTLTFTLIFIYFMKKSYLKPFIS